MILGTWPFVFLAALVLSTASPAALPADDDVDVLSYDIDARIGADGITALVTLAASAKRPVKTLMIELYGAMEIRSCRLGETDVPFNRSGWKVDLDLDAAGAPKGEFALVFKVQGRPFNQFSQDRGGFVRTNVCEEHAYIRSQYAWYPRVQKDAAAYRTVLDVRGDWLARTAGELAETREVDGRRIWRFELDRPEQNIGLAAGGYVAVEGETEAGLALDALVFPGHEEGAKALLAVAARALRFFSKLYGPVEGERFTLVEVPEAFGAGSGYGEAGYVLIGAGAFEDAGGASWAASLVAHEIAHTWWGHAVRFRHFASEMFATYATHRYTEMADGDDAARAERRTFVKRILSAAGEEEVALDAIRDWGGGMNPGVYRAHAYEKAAMLLHILEREMGREDFDEAVRKFLEKNRGRTIDYEAVCKGLGGSRFKWLYGQWGEPGIPSLRTEHEAKKSGSRCAVKGTLLQEGTDRPFRMTVDLRAVAGDETFDHAVEVKKSETAFKFTCPFEPEKILIDPDCHLIVDQSKAANVGDAAALVKGAFQIVNNPGMGDEDVLKRTIKDLEIIVAAGSPEAKESECIAGIGRCLFRLGMLDEAEEKLKKAIGMGDSGPFWQTWINLRLGCIADLRKNRSEAEGYYRNAVDNPAGSQHAKDLAARFLKKSYRGYEKDG